MIFFLKREKIKKIDFLDESNSREMIIEDAMKRAHIHFTLYLLNLIFFFSDETKVSFNNIQM
jgi:hypothetical protein